MNERQQEKLLQEVHKTSGTLGRSIPNTLTIEDESVPVREFYFAVSSEDEIAEDDREFIEEILSYLRRKRLALVQQIGAGEIDFETGKELVPRIRDLDRTINAFESLDEPCFAEQVRRERIQSARELVDLMREFGKL